MRRFKARFGDTLSVLHSQLSDRERFEEWNRINSGKTQIVVGARSALFAPFTNLGLIVVDEEHESSYKQSEAPRYMARDVAVMRGLLEKAVVILGSATPSFESKARAMKGIYEIVYLRNATIESLIGKSLYDDKTGNLIDIKPTWLINLETMLVLEKN